ncbi:unnamed protein product [Heligmosomoides polygyrus]|uniref:WAP domain-containing protein n=1 Tax=Heligmosomoides polygyrus TaxID=6339 RepID=A0A183GWD2_HELPZ|nr:unnamed protein product [Heligmosomoides polygyrus]
MFCCALLLVLVPKVAAAQQLTLCEYLRKVGRSDPYCPDLRKTARVTTESSRLAKIISILEEREARGNAVEFSKSRWNLCKTKEYKDCREDKSSCASGYSCLSSEDDDRCCVTTTANVLLPSNPTSCPPPKDMGYTCTFGGRKSLTNWCRKDSDCAASAVHLCCDSGCGFNVCLPSTGHVIDNGA